MDINCAKCGEPWDAYYIRHEAIYDTDLPEDFVKKLWDGKLIPIFNYALEREGWRFAGSIYAIIQCPRCHNQKNNPEQTNARAETRGILVEVFGNDEDGLISELNHANIKV